MNDPFAPGEIKLQLLFIRTLLDHRPFYSLSYVTETNYDTVLHNDVSRRTPSSPTTHTTNDTKRCPFMRQELEVSCL